MQKTTLSKLALSLLSTGMMATTAYAQETFTPIAAVTESGWYQMRQTAGKQISTTSVDAPLYIIAKDGEYLYSGNKSYYPLVASSTQNTEAPATNYVYISVSGSNYAIFSSNGHKGNSSAIAERNSSTTNIAVTADESGNTFTVGKYWDCFRSGSDVFLGQSMYSTNARFQFSKVSAEELDKYDVYSVSIEEKMNGSAAHADVYLTTSNAASKGLTQVYNGGSYFFTKGATVQAIDFSLSSTTAPSGFLAPVIAVNSESKTITVTYPIDYKAVLATEVVAAKEIIAKKGIGYPTEEAAARSDFQKAIDAAEAKISAATEADLNTLKAAETTYSATTANLQLPEDGKAYKMYGLFSDGTKAYLKHNENDVYIVQKQADGTFKFVNSLADEANLVYNGQGASSGKKSNTFNLQARHRINFGALNLVSAEQFTANVCIKSDGSSLNQYSTGSSNSGSWSTEWYFEPVTDFADQTVAFTASNDGQNYATVKLPYAAILPTGVTAYKGTVAGNEVTLTAYKQAGEVLPANTPVLLTATDASSYNFAPAAYQAAEETGFQGTLAAAAVTANNAYILAKKGEEVKFYLLNSENNTVNANKAYIVVSGGKAQALSFNFGTTTGIHAATADAPATAAPVFDLSGRRVVKVVKGGLYIQNGKKFIVK